MATWYRTGTVSVTNGSTTVTGVDTLWSTQIKQGDVFTIDAQKWYEVDVVTSNTSITLKSAYTGTTASAQSYAIIRNFTNTTNADLAASLAALLTKWHNREDELVSWLTNTGTVTLTKTNNTTVSVKTPTQIQNEWIGSVTKSLTNADVTLTSTEAGNAFLYTSGTLTANVNLIVPTSQSHVWFVQNNCTGSYTVTVKTSAGTGVVIEQGRRYCLYCDGTNVVSASTNATGTGVTDTPTNAMLGTAAYTNLESLVPNIPVKTSTVSSAYTVTVADWGQVVPVSGTVTVTLPDVSTMPAGFNVTISNAGTGVVTVARTGTNVIDGLTSFVLGRGMNTTFYVLDSTTNWRTIKAAQFGWRDLTAELSVKGTMGSGVDPTYEAFRGGVYGYSFSPTTAQSAIATFHIQHDYAVGTPIYLHVHWASNTSNVTGAVRWGFEYTIAKGHSQSTDSDFAAPSIVYVEQTATAQYRHNIAETASISSSLLEPDSLVLVRIFRDAAHANDTYTDKAFAFTADIHYQTDRFCTPNKSPTFYG